MNLTIRVQTYFLLLALVCIPKSGFGQFSATDLEFFESKIRPILSEHCSECHGKQVDQPEGGLSIASRAALLAGGDTGPAIVPGDPEQSLLIDSVNYTGHYEMPPSSKLDDATIELLTTWIRKGAPWPESEQHELVNKNIFDLEKRRREHWCWQPIQSHSPPEIKHPDWALDPLDNFVFEKIVGAGLEPAGDAAKPEWIRRVYFDLTGLPPTPGQIREFLVDQSANCYDKVVDELLDSPHFGERWARHWMDLFRYAESYGHEFDYAIAHAHQYRDYLIRAFNVDVPYDDLIREHVAGDLLDTPRLHPQDQFNESIIGTGFWFLGEATHAPVDVKADEAGRIDNQIDVLCKSFLGLTVACARCHDHKFDAISDEDYYALSGYLQSSRRQKAMLDPGDKIGTIKREIVPKIEKSAQHVKDFIAAVDSLDNTSIDLQAITGLKNAKEDTHPLHALHLAYAADVPSSLLRRQVFLPYGDLLQQRQAEFQKFVERSELFEGFDVGLPENWFASGWAIDSQARQGLQFSPTGSLLLKPGTISSGRYGGKFYGVLRSPTFELTHDKIHIRGRGNVSAIRLIIDGYEMDIHNALLFAGCKFELSSEHEFQWMTLGGDVKNYKGHRAWLEFIDHGDSYFEIDEIRFADSNCPKPVARPSRLGQEIVQRIRNEQNESLDDAIGHCVSKLLSHPENYPPEEAARWLSFVAENSEVGEPLLALRQEIVSFGDQVPKPPLAIAITDGTPEDEYLFIRGNSQTLGQRMPRRFLTALSEESASHVPGDGSGRLALADKIASRENPLTSRVVVNRVWHHLMGRGLVASVDNFGLLGEKPTHPELLDFLATEFCNDQWSLKRLIRRLVLSRTYRMSSELNANATEIDPENRLLHRSNVRRLQGEAIRDAMLMISGSLDRKMYGKGVPVHLTPFMQGRGRPRQGGPLDGHGRRSIYLGVRRNFLSPMMLAFDTPIPFNSIGKRHQSNVPAQALILMNDPFVIDQAKRWANRLIADGTDVNQRIEAAFQQAFGRLPQPLESEGIRKFLEIQRAELELQGEELEQQLWQDVCHTLFNMKEFIYIR